MHNNWALLHTTYKQISTIYLVPDFHGEWGTRCCRSCCWCILADLNWPVLLGEPPPHDHLVSASRPTFHLNSDKTQLLRVIHNCKSRRIFLRNSYQVRTVHEPLPNHNFRALQLSYTVVNNLVFLSQRHFIQEHQTTLSGRPSKNSKQVINVM